METVERASSSSFKGCTRDQVSYASGIYTVVKDSLDRPWTNTTLLGMDADDLHTRGD